MRNWLGPNQAGLGSGVSHGGCEKEAGELESFGDLSEVNTNVATEHLLENPCVSPVLCLSHKDLGCPVNPALPLRIQHTIPCLWQYLLTASHSVFLSSNASSVCFPQGVFLNNCSFNHPFINEKTSRALAVSGVEPNLPTLSLRVSTGHCKPWIQLSKHKTMPRFPPSCFLHCHGPHLLPELQPGMVSTENC